VQNGHSHQLETLPSPTTRLSRLPRHLIQPHGVLEALEHRLAALSVDVGLSGRRCPQWLGASGTTLVVCARDERSGHGLGATFRRPEGLTPDRYDELLYGACVSAISDPFQLLWEALNNFNEREYGRAHYRMLVDSFLRNMSNGFATQRILLSGHVVVQGGHDIVAERQLRLASHAHANPPESGEYLLFDAAQPINGVEDLLSGLGSIFH